MNSKKRGNQQNPKLAQKHTNEVPYKYQTQHSQDFRIKSLETTVASKKDRLHWGKKIPEETSRTLEQSVDAYKPRHHTLARNTSSVERLDLGRASPRFRQIMAAKEPTIAPPSSWPNPKPLDAEIRQITHAMKDLVGTTPKNLDALQNLAEEYRSSSDPDSEDEIVFKPEDGQSSL